MARVKMTKQSAAGPTTRATLAFVLLATALIPVGTSSSLVELPAGRGGVLRRDGGLLILEAASCPSWAARRPEGQQEEVLSGHCGHRALQLAALGIPTVALAFRAVRGRGPSC